MKLEEHSSAEASYKGGNNDQRGSVWTFRGLPSEKEKLEGGDSGIRVEVETLVAFLPICHSSLRRERRGKENYYCSANSFQHRRRGIGVRRKGSNKDSELVGQPGPVREKLVTLTVGGLAPWKRSGGEGYLWFTTSGGQPDTYPREGSGPREALSGGEGISMWKEGKADSKGWD